ncbi:MAG TPA: NAD(P)-dependent alcohol dehydrogenase [Acidimicrobiia bacterium]|nr:NAD(P)-dependent alcohol dehydrogenase [Acidimicrobiia bacterium]
MGVVVKAMVYERYGPPEVLELRDVDTPVPGDRDLLIRMVAASVNRSDWEGLIGKPLYARMGGLRRPRRPILGSDVAGRVVEVGSAVESFRVGDEVFGDVMYHGGSAFAEYVCVPETAPIVHKPATISFADASALPQAAVIALQGTSGSVAPGSRVLVNGAGGGAGAFAVQMAKAAGAEVTGVDNALKQEFILSLGADHVLDYAATDYTKMVSGYDLILDLVCERSMFAIRRVVAPGGRYMVVGGSVPALLSAATVGRLLSTGGRKIGVLMVRPNREDLLRVARMAATGSLRAVIERTYPLDGVPEALRHLGEGRALGKLVIEIG